MEPYRVAFRLDHRNVRLVLTAPTGDELLRASLPPPATFWSGKPARVLLESLSIWLDAPLRVVLSADDPADGFSLELADELGTGLRTVFYEVIAARPGGHRPKRLRGVGDFRDVHQLSLRDRLPGGDR
ncbi:hypothetical protein [Vulgatibacter sp.]|uniref:hypothetical protein n=1 Tax=Vulgatibacter sp. TaxID=1971226 RepID=UPI003562AB54